MIDLYNRLAIQGAVAELKIKVPDPIKFVEDTERNFDYVVYNPRKSINRFGLSITSLDGNMTGIPDLDSISEYNIENGTNYKESDFDKPTPIYYDPRLAEVISLFENNLVRSHILRIDPSGYFPAHRDAHRTGNYFRIIVPLKNVKPPQFYFIIDNEIKQLWNIGKVYFVDTIKAHVLFNASLSPSYWIVFNIPTNDKTVEAVLDNLSIC